MYFFNSIFFGTPGTYKIHNIEMTFTKEELDIDVFKQTWFGRCVNLCLGNSLFRFLTFGYLHVFIHELGHALASLLQGHKHVKIKISTNTCKGVTEWQDFTKALIGPEFFTSIAGPLAGMTLETIKLIGAIALGVLLPSFIGLPLEIAIGAGSVIWLLGELSYALSGNGDWTDITPNCMKMCS